MSSNFFSVLGDSDDEDTKVKPKTGAGDKKPAAGTAKPATGGGGKAAGAKASKKDEGDDVVTKAGTLGAREAGGHGPKQKSENRNRSRAKGDKAGSLNNQRRSGDSNAQQKKSSKDGGGANNWGNEQEEARKANKTGKADLEDEDEGGERAVESAPEPEPEPEVPTFTYEEYLAQKKATAATMNADVFGKIKERQVTDKVEGSLVQNQLDDFAVVGGLKENKSARTRNAKEKNSLVVEFSNASLDKPKDDRDRRGAGDRAGNNRRPDGSERTHRGQGRKNVKIDVNDKSAFPSL